MKNYEMDKKYTAREFVDSLSQKELKLYTSILLKKELSVFLEEKRK